MPEIFNIEYDAFKVSCLKIDLFCYFKYSYQITKKHPQNQAFINQQYEIKIKSYSRMVYWIQWNKAY